MADRMTAPERIWAKDDGAFIMAYGWAEPHAVEYVRADLAQPAAPVAGENAALVKWLRDPWSKCDDVARGPIPDWVFGLMHQAANVIEAQAAQIAELTAERDASEASEQALALLVTGYKARAEAAEATVARLVEAVQTAERQVRNAKTIAGMHTLQDAVLEKGEAEHG